VGTGGDRRIVRKKFVGNPFLGRWEIVCECETLRCVVGRADSKEDAVKIRRQRPINCCRLRYLKRRLWIRDSEEGSKQ
jgi:hypothetical protein